MCIVSKTQMIFVITWHMNQPVASAWCGNLHTFRSGTFHPQWGFGHAVRLVHKAQPFAHLSTTLSKQSEHHEIPNAAFGPGWLGVSGFSACESTQRWTKDGAWRPCPRSLSPGVRRRERTEPGCDRSCSDGQLGSAGCVTSAKPGRA